MTTAKQVKELVAPLLARHPEMALVGRAIVIKPIHHLARLVTMDRTGDANSFQPFWGVADLFHKRDLFPLGVGEPLYGPERLWFWTDTGLQQRFVELVEGEALLRLAAVKTIQDQIERSFPTEADRHQWAAGYVRMLLANGELDQARDVLATEELAADAWFPWLEELGIRDQLMSLGNALAKQTAQSWQASSTSGKSTQCTS